MRDANSGGVDIVEKYPQTLIGIMVYYGLFFAAWAIIVALLTANGQAAAYLSIDGTGDTQICVEIPKTITASYEGDVYGNWVTSKSFNQNSSAFILQFVGSKVTTKQYVATMTSFKNQLLALSRKSAMRDSGWNAVMWSSFVLYDPVAQMYFYSSADASVVYRGNIMLGCLSSASGGMCPAMSQQAHFDAPSHQFIYTVKTAKVSDAQLGGFLDPSLNSGPNSLLASVLKNNTLPIYSQVDWITSAPWQDACPQQYPSYNWSEWEPSAQNDVMSVNFDIRTIASVIAVNLNITSLSTFAKTSSAYGSDVTGGISGSFYYDTYCTSINTYSIISFNAPLPITSTISDLSVEPPLPNNM